MSFFFLSATALLLWLGMYNLLEVEIIKQMVNQAHREKELERILLNLEEGIITK